MAKFIYTIVEFQKVVIEDAGDMPYSLQSWLTLQKFYDDNQISYVSSIIRLCGINCKLSSVYVALMIDCHADPVLAGSSDKSKEAALNMLHTCISDRYREHLKNPKFSDDAKRVIEKFKTQFTAIHV